MTNYEKPRMEFTALRSQSAVAAQCWPGTKGAEVDLYVNTAGPGYAQVHFSSDGQSCKQTYSTSIILHHVLPENEGAAYQEATNAISGATGNNPNPFKGIDNFRDIPGRDWSY